jgi:LuxR family transcriptional regulator, maltose regulon positive regulatory protein
VIDDALVRGWGTQMQLRFAYLPLAVAESLRGEFDSAERHVAAGLAADANGIEAWPTMALHLAQASVAVSRRRPRAATTALQAALTVKRDRPVSPALADTLTRVIAEVAMLTGGTDDNLPVDEDTVVSATSWASRARLAFAQGDLDGTLSAASCVPRPPESGHLDDVVAAIESTICEALGALRQRRMPHATAAMGEALALAAPQRILRPFLATDTVDLPQMLGAVVAAGQVADLRDTVLERLGDAGEKVGVPEPEPLLEPLTERELAVLAQLPTMRTNEEIARDFYVSINTIKSHLTHLYRKLGVGNRREAVRRGRELGLIP